MKENLLHQKFGLYNMEYSIYSHIDSLRPEFKFKFIVRDLDSGYVQNIIFSKDLETLMIKYNEVI